MKAKNRLFCPSVEVSIYSETQNLVVTGQQSTESANSDVLSVKTVRSLGANAPTFSMNLIYKQEWLDNIGSNDLVVIKMNRPPEAEKTVFIGLIDDVRKNCVYANKKPQRVISITGTGFCKAFLKFDIGIVNEVEMSEQYLGYLGKEVSLENCPAHEAINQMITNYVDSYINYKFSDGTSLYSRLQLKLDSNPTFTILNISGLLNYQGALWNLLKEIQNAPFNEMYWEIENEQPTLILRPTPFNEQEWNAIQSTTISDEEIISESVGKSDIETYTLYAVNCATMLSGGNSMTSFGYVPLWYPKYFSKYGISRLSVVSLYTMYAGSEDADVTNLRTMKCTEDLFNWNIKNNKMYNGTISVRGSNRFKVGSKVTLESDGREYYVESVSHNFNVLESFTTQLQLTRGDYAKDRFSEPWGKFEAFDPSIFLTESQKQALKDGSYRDLGSHTGGTESTSEIVKYAKTFLGVPYVWGGTTPDGFDCSGFVQYVYKHFNIDIPRISQDQVNAGKSVSSTDNGSWMPGDLLFYRMESDGPQHVGMYVGNNKRIHAPHTGDVVKIDGAGNPCAVRRL